MYPPPFSLLMKYPKYKEIDNLNTTLHLIINNFIKNQLKVVLNLDGPTNNFTNKQQKVVLNLDGPTNNFTNKQQKVVLNLDGPTNNFINKQQINPHSMAQSLGRGCHQNKEIVQ